MRFLCILLAVGASAQSNREALEKQKASIARQQAAIRRQAETAGARMIPPPMPQPDCAAIPPAEVTPLIEGAAKTHDVEAALIRAVIEMESGFKPCVVSGKGALGLMQLMPATAEELGVRDVFDPKENIDAGARYLKQLLTKYSGDLTRALGAYNAGPSSVDQAGGTPDIPETQEYIQAILKKLGATRTVQPSIPKPKPIEN